jgi:hypothetical protein
MDRLRVFNDLVMFASFLTALYLIAEDTAAVAMLTGFFLFLMLILTVDGVQ